MHEGGRGGEERSEGRDEGEGERQLVLTGCSFIFRALPFSNHVSLCRTVIGLLTISHTHTHGVGTFLDTLYISIA